MKNQGDQNKKFYHFKLTEFDDTNCIKCVKRFKTYKSLIEYLPIAISRQRLAYHMKRPRDKRSVLANYDLLRIKEPSYVICYY